MTPTPLPARTAYPLWAPHYEAENVVTALDERVVAELSPRAAGRTLLDAGCGTGRRLPRPGGLRPRTPPPGASTPAPSPPAHAAPPRPGPAPLPSGWPPPAAPPPDTAPLAVGVDLVPEMLAAGRARRPAGPPLIAADVTALPLRDGVFDLVWCRLVAGHIAGLPALYRELARVCRPGAVLVVTDFHPAAVRAGHERTFRDAAGRIHAVEHHVHEAEDHERAACAAGLALERRRDGEVGEEVRPFYERAGALGAYEAQQGLPLVLGLRFRR